MNNAFSRRRSLLACLRPAILSAALCCAAAAEQAQWPNWRGPNRNGSIESGTYPVQWDAAKPRWKFELPGKGTSTPIVWNDRIYLTSPAGGEDAVLALDLDGKLLWQTKLGKESPPKHRTLGSSSNASPITDGNGVFVYFKSGHFAAIEMDGTVRWSLNVAEKFGPDNLFWDQGTSPALTERDVILARMHGGDSWVAGFDKKTGEMRWRQERNYRVPTENDNGYSTPVLIEHNGQAAFLLWGADHLTAHNAADGKLLWSCGEFNPRATGYWPAIATPVIAGNVVVVPVGRDDRPGQAAIHGIKLGGSGDVSLTHRLWKREDIGVFVATPAEFKGRVYLLRHRGGVVCIDPANGETLWSGEFPKSSASYYSSPVIAGGILYAAREDGTVFAAAIGKEFELKGENAMGERIISSPVPVRDRLLIRGDRHLFCIGAD